MTKIQLPNETDEYRHARQELLQEEMALRSQIERVAKLRRALPPGGEVPEDYIFQEWQDNKSSDIRISDLFQQGKDTLFLYSFMYSPDMKHACPMCTSLLDALNSQAEQLSQKLNVAVVAKNPIEKIVDYAEYRGWKQLKMLSSAYNTYNVDYLGGIDGRQTTTVNVFVKKENRIYHFWNSELSYAPMMEGTNMRHLDLIWPIWNVLDMTPEGRENWYPHIDTMNG